MVSLEKSDLHMYFCVQETVLELSERRKTTVFSHGGLLKNMLKVPFSPDKLKTFSLFLKVFFSALIKVFEESDSFKCPHHKLQDLYKPIISFVNLNWLYTMLYFWSNTIMLYFWSNTIMLYFWSNTLIYFWSNTMIYFFEM